jgi:hypothetical protein
MKASELRIGNYVMHGAKVVAIDPKWISIEYYNPLPNIEKFEIETFKPMLLTHNHLIQFGFTLEIFFEGDPPIYYLPNKEFQIDYETFQPLYTGLPIGIYKIKYVHQLQNLYYSLTCEELTIKEPAV